MIVECPECSTRFSLPPDRVTTRGSKVRCSKCNHTFRVRLGSAGTAEVYYKNEGVADPPTQDLADLFDESFAEDLDLGFSNTLFSSPGNTEDPVADDEVDPRKTMIGLPSTNREEGRSKSAAPDYNPFPFAPVKAAAKPEPVEKTPAPAAPVGGIDLFDGGTAALPAVKAQAMVDPFADVFDEVEKTDAPAPVLAASTPTLSRASAPSPVEPKPTYKKPLMSSLPLDDLPDEHEILGNQASDFGPAEDLVDPSFGQENFYDPNAAEEAPAPAPAPVRAAPRPAGRPAPAAAKQQPKRAPAPRPVDLSDEFDAAPHRIGGGGFQKFVNFIFILILAVVAVLGYVAFRTNGILDFGQFDNMMDVLVEGKAYTPRDEWVKAAPAPAPVEPANPISAENVFSRLLPVGKKDSILVVSGDVANAGGKTSEPVKIRVMLLDDQQKVLGEMNTVSGRIIDFDALAGAQTTEEVAQLSPASPKGVEANASTPFMAVFTDPPARARENKAILVRVELR